MKFIQNILFTLLALGTVSAQTFTKVPGAATDVAVAPNGSVYVVGTSKRVFKWNTSKKNWDTFYDAGRQAKFIDAQNNYLNTVNSRGQLFSTNTSTKSSRLLKSLGSGLKDYGQKGAMILSTGIALNQPARDIKQTLADAPVNNKVAAVNEQSMYVIKNDKSIWFCQRNKKGVKLPGAALDIAYDPIKKKVYVIGTSKRIFVWNTSRRNWDTVRNTRNDFANLAVNNGVIWATTTKGDIYTTASTSSGTSNAGVYKLKITLNNAELGSRTIGESEYLLRFNTNLKLKGKNQILKNKKSTKIPNEIRRYGAPNYLYVSRKRTESDFNKVLFKVPAKRPKNYTINNSGVFEIPKNMVLSDTDIEFRIDINLAEVAKGTEYLIRESALINLKEIMAYLLHKKASKNYGMTSVNDPFYKNKEYKKHKLANGYRSMMLGQFNGKRIVKDIFLANNGRPGNNSQQGVITYTLELVD